MSRNRLLVVSLVLVVLSALLPLFNITLPFGNPNLGSAPATLAGLYLPWPVGIICGVVKGIAASLATGRWLVEMPSGIGDALSALFTWWLARQVRSKSLAGLGGQLSRFILTSGTIAVVVSGLVAVGLVPVSQVSVAGLTSSFIPDAFAVWKAISYPSIAISVAFNIAFVLLAVLIFRNWLAAPAGRSQPSR